MCGHGTAVITAVVWPLSVSSSVVVVPLTWPLRFHQRRAASSDTFSVGWRCTWGWNSSKAFSTVWGRCFATAAPLWQNAWNRNEPLLLHALQFCDCFRAWKSIRRHSTVAKHYPHTVLKAFDEFRPLVHLQSTTRCSLVHTESGAAMLRARQQQKNRLMNVKSPPQWRQRYHVHTCASNKLHSQPKRYERHCG